MLALQSGRVPRSNPLTIGKEGTPRFLRFSVHEPRNPKCWRSGPAKPQTVDRLRAPCSAVLALHVARLRSL